MATSQFEEPGFISLNEIHHEIACENNQKLLIKLLEFERDRGKGEQSLVSTMDVFESESPIYKCSKKCSSCISIDKSGNCAIKKEIKKLEPRFPDFCKGIGVNVQNLKGSDNQYSFPIMWKGLIRDIIVKYPDEKSIIGLIRRGKMDEVPYLYGKNLDSFLYDCMESLGKDQDTIDQQMKQFHRRTGWRYEEPLENCKQSIMRDLNLFKKSVWGSLNLSIGDKLLIMNESMAQIRKHLIILFDEWQEILEAMEDIRMEEMSDKVCDLTARNEFAQYLALRDAIGFEMAKDSKLKKLDEDWEHLSQSERLQDRKKAHQIQLEICKRKEELEYSIRLKHPLSPDQERKINEIYDNLTPSEEVLENARRDIAASSERIRHLLNNNQKKMSEAEIKKEHDEMMKKARENLPAFQEEMTSPDSDVTSSFKKDETKSCD